MYLTVKHPTNNRAHEPTGDLTTPQPILATIKAVEAAIAITEASIARATARIAIMKAELPKINAMIAALDIAIPRVTAKMAALDASLPAKFASLSVRTPEPAVKLGAAETTTAERKPSTSSSPVPSSASADFSAFAPHTLLSRRSARHLFPDSALEGWRCQFPAASFAVYNAKYYPESRRA